MKSVNMKNFPHTFTKYWIELNNSILDMLCEK